ncbi:Transglutaminase-like superfamily protein [Duganella sacchari]|uniref:Transglutaminase-like superfamily protein n=1 Tax=Duganella sacchari TaxID=551987 RepID=A0A1M7NV72_9BURK|nr:Transglutaminase-like superfamily protein [Duganella sacchari]
MKLKLLAALCAAALLSSHALAADDGTDRSVSVLKNLQHFVVQRDGSYMSTEETLVQLNEQRAIAGEAQRQFHFNRTLEDVEIVEAYTEKPDGRRIAVLPGQIKLQQEPAYAGAPMFQDMQVKTVIYAEVEVGDKLYSKIRRKRSSAQFSGQFYDRTTPYFNPTKQQTLIYDLPADMQLKVDERGYMASPPEQHENRTVYRWDYLPADNARIEADAVAYSDYGQHLIVSTFDSYGTIGLAYDRAAKAAAKATPHIEAKARELVQGLSDPREKAHAIGNWVRKNIRYVAVYIGNGGIEPHSAESILKNRYGDCKDHVALMEAMLGAVGIDSTPALINYGSAYKLSPVAHMEPFNHVITYIPGLDLYIDSTANNLAVGYLPFWDLDKQVILTRTGAMGHTPVSQAGKVKNVYTVQIAADGSAQFRFTRDNLGSWEEEVRTEIQNWNKNDQSRFVESLLKANGIKGSGTVDAGDPDNTNTGKGYQYSLHGKGENWAYLPGTVGLVAASSLYAGLWNQVFRMTNETTRTQPFICYENDFEEQASYQFPQNARLLAVPPDVDIASPYFQYHARFKQTEGKLVIERSLKSGKAGTKVCTPEDQLAMQADIKKMVRDLRSQFILQVPDLPGASASAN